MSVKSSSDRYSIYLDFDGPVIDLSERSYQAYRDALDFNLGEKPLDKEAYLRIKRNKTPLKIIYKKSMGKINYKKFQSQYLKNIEDKRYLMMDRLNKNVIKFFRLHNHNRLVLVTLRRNRKNLMNELRRFKIDRFFDKVLNKRAGRGGGLIKANLIRKDKLFNKKNSFIIGDTEADISAGKILGIKTVAVLNGIRSHYFLRKLSPDITVQDLTELKIS